MYYRHVPIKTIYLEYQAVFFHLNQGLLFNVVVNSHLYIYEKTVLYTYLGQKKNEFFLPAMLNFKELVELNF